MDNPDYRANSLTAVAEWAADQIDQRRSLSEATYATTRYDALLDLFNRMDQGDKALGIPHYNGGLFNPASPENQFLRANKLSDQAVVRAIDLLVRDQGQPVDYAYISVRNFGAIYEGLLENKLTISNADTSAVLLVNDRGERKATGSYYTPDYIVEYIVRNTLDPILDARQSEFQQAMDKITDLRKTLLKTGSSTTARRLGGELAEAERLAREAFLGIKVLDPAMGSGHFLVNAVDHLTDGIIQRLQAYHDEHPEALWEWDPIQQLIENVRGGILQEMAGQGLSVDARRLDDTALLTRLVMKRCIYGVDLNRMAVELAKVSLWLHSFTIGAPLSFLDHHLRWGNSLIGADVRIVEDAMSAEQQKSGGLQYSLFAGPFAGLLDLTAVMTEVAERADATLADVRQSTQAFEGLQRSLTPYKEVLDLWVSQYFGNREALEFLTLFGGNVLPALRGEQPADEKYQKVIETARRLCNEKHFFHWDLEFPEVFVDLHKRDWAQNGGFDAVVSNPPYKDIKGLEKDLVKYLFEIYLTTENRTNIFSSFFERGLSLLNQSSANIGFIIPTSFLTQVTYHNLRKKILERYWIRGVVRLPNELFGDAMGNVKVDTCIVIAGTRSNQADLISQVLIYNSFVRKEFIFPGNADKCFILPQNKWFVNPEQIISLSGLEEASILEKIKHISEPLGSVCVFCLGLTPYDKYSGQTEEEIKNKVFHANSRLDSTYKKLLLSGDIGRYSVVWNGLEWIKYGSWLAAPREQRFFTQERILVQQIIDWSSLRIFAGLTSDELYNTQNQFNLLAKEGTNLKFILAIICSKMMSFYHRSAFLDTALQRFQKVLIKDAKTFPIRRICFTTPIKIRNDEFARVKNMYTADNTSEILTRAKIWLTCNPEKADLLNDLLAFLAEQMIELNKTRQAELNGFLVWLTREIGLPLGDLTGKTIIQNYLGDYQMGEEPATLEQILSVLRRNQKKLGVDVSARTFQERLEKEYTASLEKLLPVKQKLAATDRLIDQIVYALYELTDEEIAIVEGRA